MPSSDSALTRETFNSVRDFNSTKDSDSAKNFNEMVRRQRTRIYLIRTFAILPDLHPMEREILTREMENLVDEHEALRRNDGH